MARFIDLDSVDPNQILWLVPQEWIRYDQRDPPWPNPLWPYMACIRTDGPDFNAFYLIALRRWCERNIVGDVAVRFSSERDYQDTLSLYTDNLADHLQICDHLAIRLVYTQEHTT